MKSLLRQFANVFRRKSAPAYLPDQAIPGSLDAYRRLRPPTGADLLQELKGTAWTCASINASLCASFPPRLYMSARPDQTPRVRQRLGGRSSPHVQEVVDHPLLTLLEQVNPVHNAFDLWELTQLYLEVHGSAYWLLDFDPILNVPSRVWILPAHLVSPRRDPASDSLVDYYEYRGRQVQRFSPSHIVHFRCPDPRDPYLSGMSPLRACFEQVALTAEYAAFKRSIYDNTGLPGAIITPEEAIGPDERARLEQQWQQKFRRGGQGQALVAESSLKVTMLAHSMGDLAALADMKATKEDIANAFHIPLPFLTGDTNLANMQAADHLHKTLAILPRLRRRDEKLNEQLIPLFDPTGQLFFATDDPTPANQHFVLQQEQADLKLGVRTVNEIRSNRGLAPVPWGDSPASKIEN